MGWVSVGFTNMEHISTVLGYALGIYALITVVAIMFTAGCMGSFIILSKMTNKNKI